MIALMSHTPGNSRDEMAKKEPPSLWKSILFLIIFSVGAVVLFGAIIYLFIRGAEQMKLPFIVHIAIFVIISGIFAWLLKRITDEVSELSRYWFPEDVDDDK